MVQLGSGMVRAFTYALLLVAVAVALLPACALPSVPFTTPPGSPNPPWPQQCPLRIALVVDLSDSMESNLDVVERSAGDLVEALGEAPNEVAVVVFGSAADVAVPMADVGDDDIRRQVRDQVADLGATRGSTNWEAALTAARSLQPDVVIMLTDGEPDSLATAVRSANALKGDGTRVVGLGVGLQSSSVANLVAVTGPAAGDDFYQTSASGLLDKLYEVASKACGVQVGPLPLPEPALPPPAPPATGSFPLIPAIVAGLVAVLAIGVGGALLSRRRSGPVAVSKPTADPLPDPTISLDDLPPVPSTVVADDPSAGAAVVPTQNTEEDDGSAPGDTPVGRSGGVRGPRRISLRRSQQRTPPHQEDHDSGSGAGGSST
ncbi:MAG: vWA domain-containing protein [Pseudonocardiaceae bacterium]